MSSVKGMSIGKARVKLAKMASEVDYPIGYLVEVSGHALLLTPNGKTWVDTDTRQRDARKILKLYIVYAK
tara:strand:+ start:3223 stop:3432 length:210 start_codon:yes stop_codon:yes gene_type:complete